MSDSLRHSDNERSVVVGAVFARRQVARWLRAAAALSLLALAACATPPPVASGAVRERFVASRLGQLHLWTFEAERPTGAPPLFLVHQTSLSAREYLPLALELAHERRVYAIDLPGYGESASLAGPPSIEQYAAAVEDAIDALDPVPLDLMGTHGGSLIAAQIALDRPRRIRRLVMAGVVIETLEEQAVRSTAIVRDEAFDAIFERLQVGAAKLMRSTDDCVMKERYAMLIVDSLRAYDHRWYLFDASTRYAALERLPTITQPTLLVAFDDDLRTTTFHAHELLPNAAFEDLAPLATLPYYRGTSTVAAVLRRFLDTR